MKKTLLPVVLIIALVTLMSTGSLAIYTQTRQLRGRLHTRVFLFNAGQKSTDYDLGLSGLTLAPGGGEKELYRFELTNANASDMVSDYHMTASISSSGMAQAMGAMQGLVFRLYDASKEGGAPLATVASGELSQGGLQFVAGQRQTMAFRVTAQWPDNGDSAAQTALAASGAQYSISLSVSATELP